MPRIIFFIALCTFALSCKTRGGNVKTPENKIERNEFIKLLIDVNLLEGHLTNLNVNLPEIRDLSLGQYKHVFENHEINYTQYKENYDYYIQQDNYKEILQVVYDSLDSMSIRYDNVKPYKEISFVQYKLLLQKDSIAFFLEHDTILSHNERIDTILNFYRKHQEKIKVIDIDSISFEKNILKLRKNKVLFESVMRQVYSK